MVQTLFGIIFFIAQDDAWEPFKNKWHHHPIVPEFSTGIQFSIILGISLFIFIFLKKCAKK